MFKVSIKNQLNQETHAGTFTTRQLADEWVDSNVANNSWGLPDRWLSFTTAPDPGYTDERIVEDSITGEDRIEYFYPCLYTVTITDITAQANAEKESREALEYLEATDWYIIREMDTGEVCPANIKTARALARTKVL